MKLKLDYSPEHFGVILVHRQRKETNVKLNNLLAFSLKETYLIYKQ